MTFRALAYNTASPSSQVAETFTGKGKKAGLPFRYLCAEELVNEHNDNVSTVELQQSGTSWSAPKYLLRAFVQKNDDTVLNLG
jgi:hypothetical protein